MIIRTVMVNITDKNTHNKIENIILFVNRLLDRKDIYSAYG